MDKEGNFLIIWNIIHDEYLVIRPCHELIQIEQCLFYQYSTRQTSIERPPFSSEFMAMKYTIKYVCSLKYNLQMIDINIDGCIYDFHDIRMC